MKALVCEMCNSNDVVKQDGVFVCQYCGTKYSVEEAKKMMFEGTVDVSGSTIRIDNTGEIDNLLGLARLARKENNFTKAKEYYEKVLLKEHTNWEANYCIHYFNWVNSGVLDIASASKTYHEYAEIILDIVKNNYVDEAVRDEALKNISLNTINGSKFLYEKASNIPSDVAPIGYPSMASFNTAILNYFYAKTIADNFDEKYIPTIVVPLLENGNQLLAKFISRFNYNKKANSDRIFEQTEYIKRYKPDYVCPIKEKKSWFKK